MRFYLKGNYKNLSGAVYVEADANVAKLVSGRVTQ